MGQGGTGLATSRDLSSTQHCTSSAEAPGCPRHHMATWPQASLLPLVATATSAQGSPPGPQMQSLIRLSPVASGWTAAPAQELGAMEPERQDGGGASGLGGGV
jgi:hypothetical protein